MQLHANPKLGLSGRYALVSAIRGRPRTASGRGRLQRLAGDGAPLVAPLPRGRRRQASRPCRPLKQATPTAASALGRRRGADPARPPGDRLPAGASCLDPRPRALDGLEGARPARALAPAAPAAAGFPPLRVVAAGSAAPRRRQALDPVKSQDVV
jgi:hypothetical protein